MSLITYNIKKIYVYLIKCEHEDITQFIVKLFLSAITTKHQNIFN